MLSLLVFLVWTTSAYDLTCHCLNDANCSANGFCADGCDVGWYGPGCQIGNVALNKPANQSSTYTEGQYVGSASLALDGRVPNTNGPDYCSHTLPNPIRLMDGTSETIGGSAWWYVTLSTTLDYVITSITLFNRKGFQERRLQNFSILYSNESEGDPHPNRSSIWQLCAQEPGIVNVSKTYTCNTTAIGKRVAVFIHYTADAILTLCEVQIFGYPRYDCTSGFTGPGCLLRACDVQCISTGGQCNGNYSSCSYSICPDKSLLPPDCWITLSNYSGVNIQSTVTCETVRFSVQLPDAKPNIPAPLLQLIVNASDYPVVLMNETRSVLTNNDTVHFNYSRAVAGTSYRASVKPFYCNVTGRPCFYASGSEVLASSTGVREYWPSNNNTCFSVDVNSTTVGCELPTAIQVSCEDHDFAELSVNSSSNTACGLERGRQYNCSVIAVIDAGRSIVETRTAFVITQPLDTSRASKNDMSVDAISIGCSIAAVVIVILVIIAVVYCRRQRTTKRSQNALLASHDTYAKSHAQADALDLPRLSSHNTKPSTVDDEQTYGNLSGMTLSQFQLYVQDEAVIARRFSELQANEAHPCIDGKSIENKGKNRFQNILPYDCNRVRLDNGANGYINASYINGFSRQNEYIAAQGPTSKTIEDFWLMLWQEKCSVIIMLTDYVEHAKRKCEKYFPFTSTHGLDIEATVSSTTVFDTHSVSVLTVRQGSEVRLVHHFHFLTWPDQSVPSHSAEMLLFYSRICLHLKRRPSVGPLVVHCSAGVGRTGAFIAFDYLLQRYQSESTLDVDSCVVNLRDQRMLMVQTKEQYLFLHRVVMYGLKSLRYIYDAAQLSSLLRTGSLSDSRSTIDMSAEWQELQALAPTFNELSFAAGVLPENKRKNRRSHILALESKRPILCRPDDGTQLYINAVYCNGCYSNRAFIATQLPLSATVSDFWLMVYDCQPSCIVLLHDLPADDQDCPRYWPEPGHSLTAGRLEVRCDGSWKEDSSSNARMPGFDISLTPASGRVAESSTVSTKLFKTSLWGGNSSSDLPTNANDLAVFANALRTYCVAAPQQPIVVQCRDGVTQCGLFLAAVNALHRLIETEQVSVFHTLDLLRSSRPEFITNEAQFRFIYQFLVTYNDSCNVYANT